MLILSFAMYAWIYKREEKIILVTTTLTQTSGEWSVVSRVNYDV